MRFHRRLRKWWWHHLLGPVLSACAFLWRRLMFRTTFIAITGSAGKTTTTACVGSILAAHFPTNWERGGRNSRAHLALIILRTRFRHRFTVIEVGTRVPGALRRAAWMIAPDIAVVLTVLNLHTDGFPTIEKMAREKEQLLSRLGKRGVAILNADDERVREMGTRRTGPVRTFGRAGEADLRVSEISSVWPARLGFRAQYGDESCRVETQLVGEHMAIAATAALSVAVCCGVPLDKAAEALRNIEPVQGRMRPLALPNGATILRDDYQPSLPSLVAGLEVVRTAQAQRRIVVVGDVLDSLLAVRPRMRDLGRRVAGAADAGIFIGVFAKIAARAATEAGLRETFVCADVREASELLRRELRAGDLVYTHEWIAHHLERVALAQTGTFSCWRERCTKVNLCDVCPELKFVPFPPAPPVAAANGN